MPPAGRLHVAVCVRGAERRQEKRLAVGLGDRVSQAVRSPAVEGTVRP